MNYPTSLYDQYKKATADVLSWLKSSLTGLGQKDMDTVGCILQAADSVRAARKAVPSTIMQSLEKAIMLREKVAAKHKSPDEGHMHFLEVLKEMRAMFSRSGTKATPTKEDEDEPENRFSALSVEDAVAETDEPFEEEPEPTPAPPEKRKEWEHVDIAKDTEWFMIRCFIADLENLMRHVRSAWEDFKEHTVPIFVPTAITNLSITLVKKLSSTLQLDYPYLTTLDHIIAVIYYDDKIDQIMTKFPHITYRDAIEAIVLGRHASDEVLEEIMAEEISKKFQIKLKAARRLVAQILRKEEILESEGEFFKECESLLFFHHTQSYLIQFKDIYNRKSMYGIADLKWNEKSNPAANPSDLLREYSFMNVLPTMVKVIGASSGYARFPGEEKVIPLVTLFRELLLKNVVGFEIAFAWHAMIWAAFVYQGDMRCSKLSVTSSLKMKQLKESFQKDMEVWDFNAAPNVEMLSLWFKNITDDYYNSLTARQKIIGLYNPYMAGQRLTMGYYAVAIHAGCWVIDSVGQLRIILHYYNAFRILGLIKELPLLEFLITQFSKAKWLWIGGRPTEKGQFIKAFLLAWGHNITTAEKQASYWKRQSLPTVKSSRPFKAKAKGLQIIYPGPLVKAYRAVVENNYTEFPHDCVNDFGLYFGHLKKLILDDCNDSLLGYNLFSLGRIFLEIRRKLLETLGFEDLVQEKMKFFGRDSEDHKTCMQIETQCLYFILALCDTCDTAKNDEDMGPIRKAVKLLEESIDGLREEQYRYDL
ncbi:hypothetical protein HDU96_004580 [Phlyctochytrium bullatum]|nr:hypothetical protein HDU96_004580 [Phlyctochytrium bullatum]